MNKISYQNSQDYHSSVSLNEQKNSSILSRLNNPLAGITMALGTMAGGATYYFHKPTGEFFDKIGYATIGTPMMVSPMTAAYCGGTLAAAAFLGCDYLFNKKETHVQSSTPDTKHLHALEYQNPMQKKSSQPMLGG